jgi:hypothetical protein
VRKRPTLAALDGVVRKGRAYADYLRLQAASLPSEKHASAVNLIGQAEGIEHVLEWLQDATRSVTMPSRDGQTISPAADRRPV